MSSWNFLWLFLQASHDYASILKTLARAAGLLDPFNPRPMQRGEMERDDKVLEIPSHANLRREGFFLSFLFLPSFFWLFACYFHCCGALGSRSLDLRTTEVASSKIFNISNCNFIIKLKKAKWKNFHQLEYSTFSLKMSLNIFSKFFAFIIIFKIHWLFLLFW